MPWKEANALNLKSDFVHRAVREEMPFAQLCREFGISTKTGYKWKERFLAEGSTGLFDLSRRPHSCASAVDENTICELVRLKKKHPRWGPDKIRALFQAHPRGPVPSLSTVKRVLAKSGLTEPRPKRRPSDKSGRIANHIEPTAPNQVWSVDFKGWWYSTSREKVLPLTVCDAFSRYILAAQIMADGSTESVQACFVQLFTLYGLPLVIRSDNGAPFACTRAPLGLSRLSVWWVSLGIGLDRIAPGHPEQNGRHRYLAPGVQLRTAAPSLGQPAAMQCLHQVRAPLRS
jgi:transposase InsO family protein